MARRPYPTGAWWLNLMLEKGEQNVGVLPYAVRATADTGIEVRPWGQSLDRDRRRGGGEGAILLCLDEWAGHDLAVAELMGYLLCVVWRRLSVLVHSMCVWCVWLGVVLAVAPPEQQHGRGRPLRTRSDTQREHTHVIGQATCRQIW